MDSKNKECLDEGVKDRMRTLAEVYDHCSALMRACEGEYRNMVRAAILELGGSPPIGDGVAATERALRAAVHRAAADLSQRDRYRAALEQIQGTAGLIDADGVVEIAREALEGGS